MSPLVVQPSYISKIFPKVPSRGFQMVTMARLWLAMAPTLSLKVLTTFRLALQTRSWTKMNEFQQKVNNWRWWWWWWWWRRWRWTRSSSRTAWRLLKTSIFHLLSNTNSVILGWGQLSTPEIIYLYEIFLFNVHGQILVIKCNHRQKPIWYKNSELTVQCTITKHAHTLE